MIENQRNTTARTAKIPFRRFHLDKMVYIVVICVGCCMFLAYYLLLSEKTLITIGPHLNAGFKDAASHSSGESVEMFPSARFEGRTPCVNIDDDCNPYFYGYLIKNSGICRSSDSGVPALVVVYSAADHFAEREAVRHTWGNASLQRGFKLGFLLGKPSRYDIQHNIIAEGDRHGDIIQGNFTDTYYNLTLKSVTMVHWAAKFCPDAKYVLKIDDDMMLNIWSFTSTLKRLERETAEQNTIWGRLAKKLIPIRNPWFKWHVPVSMYPRDRFPDFVFGRGYLISNGSVGLMYRTSATVPFIYLEDVFMTGLVAEKAEIRRVRELGFKPSYTEFEPCSWRKIITTHGYSPQRLESTWSQMTSKMPTVQLDCTTEDP